MKNLVLASIITTVLLTGCASSQKSTDAEAAGLAGNPIEADFLEKNGPVKLTFDDKGQWLSIESSATAPLGFDAAEGREVAFKVATMRAKRNLVEFIQNDLQSRKSVQTISNAYLKSVGQTDSSYGDDTDSEDGERGSNQTTREMRQKANKIAMTVRERIDDNAQMIMKGVHITDRKVSSRAGHVAVTVRVSRNSIRAADAIRAQMGQ